MVGVGMRTDTLRVEYSTRRCRRRILSQREKATGKSLMKDRRQLGKPWSRPAPATLGNSGGPASGDDANVIGLMTW
jgi:hypothetical protein